MEHKLKVKNEYLENMIKGTKRAEVRLNDRDFQVGDTCILYDISNLRFGKIDDYSKSKGSYKISHIHSGLGMADNYVILSFKKFDIRY